LAGLLNRARLGDRPRLFDPLRLLNGPRLRELPRLLLYTGLLNRARLGGLPGLFDHTGLLDRPRLGHLPHLLCLPPTLVVVLHSILIVLAHRVRGRTIVSEGLGRPTIDPQ
jgi:hypothetical protein